MQPVYAYNKNRRVSQLGFLALDEIVCACTLHYLKIFYSRIERNAIISTLRTQEGARQFQNYVSHRASQTNKEYIVQSN